MGPDSTKPNDTENQKSLDQEVREMISTLTTRLGSIQRSQKPGSSSTQTQDNSNEDDQGVRIITLAGTNLGATMRGETTDDKTSGGPQGSPDLPEHEDFATYVNSNFQAINNSIMFGGSYTTNDPGVHLDITDYMGREEDVVKNNGKKVRRNNKRGSYKSDNLIEGSDKNTSDGERSWDDDQGRSIYIYIYQLIIN